MVNKCANPNCSSAFTYFRQGRLYVIDPRSRQTAAPWPATKLEYYWLCGECAAHVEIVADGDAITLCERVRSNAAP